jgi:glycine/D-amino acid oxidase-like deaminating enzyme
MTSPVVRKRLASRFASPRARTLRFYYPLLPDDRLQIGSRSAVTGAEATEERHQQLLIDGLNRKFPTLRGIDIDYSWWGWVDMSHDMMPRIFRPDPQLALVYALGFGGNGVSYSAQAGRRMTQMIAGRSFDAQDLPIFNSPLPTHFFRPSGDWGSECCIGGIRHATKRPEKLNYARSTEPTQSWLRRLRHGRSREIRRHRTS